MKFCSFDIETTGFKPYKDKIFSYCIGDWGGEVDVRRLDREDCIIKNSDLLDKFMNDTSIAKVCHNFHFELSFLKSHGISIPENTVWHDTMLMSQLLRNLAPSHALDALAWELCGYSRELDVKVKTMGKKLGGYQHIPESIMRPYQIADGERTMLLFQLWYPIIKADKKLYEDYLNEIELVKTTQRLEEQGIMVDVKEAMKLKDWLENQLILVRNKTLYHFGEFYNWNSDDQVRKILYKDLNLPITAFTQGGLSSTGKAILLDYREKYTHPVFDLILQTRSYTKGLAMINNYLEHMDKNNIIHPKINTNQARTGRESSSDPNLQNVAKSEVLLNPFPVPARRCFRALPKHVLFFGDYSGIEMRLIIDASGETSWMKLLKEGKDIHTEAAKLFYGNLFKGEKVKRNAAKNANFAKPYGAGLASVAKSLGLSIVDAQPGFDRYCKAVPSIAYFSSTIFREVQELGYVQTPFGRKLYLPDDKAYSGANYLIQGTAAGIIKRAQVKVDNYLRRVWQDKIRLILPVHDELVLSYPRNLLKYSSKILMNISKLMINIPEIKVPLEVEWSMSTTTWEKAKKYETT